jgi:plastocyanin
MTRTLGLAATALAIVVAGCGSSSSNSSGGSSSAATSPPASTTPSASSSAPSGGASSNVKLSADPGGALKFDKSSLSAKSGNVTLTMANPSAVPHGVAIEGNGVDKDGSVVNKGGKSTVTASLKPGTYTYYCPVPGHRQAGMEGKLTVK